MNTCIQFPRTTDGSSVVQGSAFELESLEAEAIAQETAAKDTVERAKKSAKLAYDADQKLLEEQVSHDFLRQLDKPLPCPDLLQHDVAASCD